MKELFDVRFNRDGSFDMRLANGTITVPGYNGCYVLSTGCGTGKTECCKSIIRQCHQQGILYCVDTIEELDKMYNWIISEWDSIGITPDDVMVISSDSRHEWFLRQYQNNPEILMTKKIVLITHARFWTDLINYFLIYQPQYRVDPFDGDFQSLMSRPDLRKFVIFDETPKFIQPFFEMPKCLLAAFAGRDMNRNWQCLSPYEIRERYSQFFKDSQANPFPKDTTRIGRNKRDVILNLIPGYFNLWCNSTDGNLSMTFMPIHLAQPSINTRVMILEGAGDVLFQGSRYYSVLDLKDKYNCPIRFEQFQFEFKRRAKIEASELSNFISTLANRILLNQHNRKKTLIVVWKNQGADSRKSDDSKFYKDVWEKMGKIQELNKEMYDIIYYGSAECKSTNQYRDYSEIILVGDWNMTNAETSKFNNHFGVNIDTDSHKLWFFIQLLSRIGIRCHDRREYTVCYSSDFSPKFISKLDDYLSRNTLSTEVNTDNVYQDLIDYLSTLGIRSNYLKEILSLCEYESMITEHLIRQEQYTLSISLDKIFKIIPKVKKKKEKYKNLVRVMSTLGITLSII